MCWDLCSLSLCCRSHVGQSSVIWHHSYLPTFPEFPRQTPPTELLMLRDRRGFWGVPAWGPALNITLHNPVDTSATTVRKARLSLNDARMPQGRLSFLGVEATEKNHLLLVCRKISKQLVSQLIACLRLLCRGHRSFYILLIPVHILSH